MELKHTRVILLSTWAIAIAPFALADAAAGFRSSAAHADLGLFERLIQRSFTRPIWEEGLATVMMVLRPPLPTSKAMFT